MEATLAALEALPPVAALRLSRWGYMAVNTAHIAGFALLVGAMLPLNLARLAGRRDAAFERRLVPFAAAGLAIAVLAGAALFATRAREYAALDVVRVKLALVAAGTATALLLHVRFGRAMERASPLRRRLHAGASLLTWLAVLVLGRAIAFV